MWKIFLNFASWASVSSHDYQSKAFLIHLIWHIFFKHINFTILHGYKDESNEVFILLQLGSWRQCYLETQGRTSYPNQNWSQCHCTKSVNMLITFSELIIEDCALDWTWLLGQQNYTGQQLYSLCVMVSVLAVASHGRRSLFLEWAGYESIQKAGFSDDPVIVSYLKLITLGSIEYTMSLCRKLLIVLNLYCQLLRFFQIKTLKIVHFISLKLYTVNFMILIVYV